ncbi:MAG: zinc-dependent alcohol dehydrogenase family protein [Pseudomonadota bacterium]
MRRILVEEFGDPVRVCRLQETEPDGLGPRTVRVRMIARPINPSDLIPITGAYAARLTPPFVPGFEGVGTVVDHGPAVEDFQRGQRVLPLGRTGTWSELVDAEADWCVPVPDWVAMDLAAQAYINPATAWCLLTSVLDLAPGEAIVVNACGSAISKVLLALAKARDLRFIALVHGADRSRQWQAMGADDVIDCDRRTIAAGLETARRTFALRAGLDAIGGPQGMALAEALPPEARFVQYGLLSGKPLAADLAERMNNRIKPEMFWLRSVVHAMPPEERLALFEAIFAFFRAHPVDLAVEARYDLAEIGAALRHNARRGRSGKVLLEG